MHKLLSFTVEILVSAVVLTAMTAGTDRQAVGGLAGAQAGTATAGAGVLIGHVVDAGTTKALSGVIVTLARDGTLQRVVVDASGAFVFSRLRPGIYSLTAQKPGYADGANGRRLPGGSSVLLDLADSDKLTDLTLRLWKFGSIAGTVTDEAGEPVVGINVQVLQQVRLAGRRTFTIGAMVVTDDRGAYRFASLTPGDFLVAIPSKATTLPGTVMDESSRGASRSEVESAVQSMAQTVMAGQGDAQRVGNYIVLASVRAPVPPDPNDDGTFGVYPTAFLPNIEGTTGGASISLGSGEERGGVDFQLKPVRSFRVTGTLVGPDGPVPAQPLTLVPQAAADGLYAESDLVTASTITDGKGAFALLGVPPGQYILRALVVPGAGLSYVEPTFPPQRGRGGRGLSPIPDAPTLWASELVTVPHEDVLISVVLKRGLRVSGRFQFDGTKPPPTDLQMRQTQVVVEAINGRPFGGIPPGHGEANGTFTTFGMPAGRYFVRVGEPPPGWFFKAAMFDGKDRSETPIDLKSGDINGVVVIFGETPAHIAGTVRTQGAASADAIVLLFPTDQTAWVDYGVNGRRVRSVRPSRSGAYSFSNPPAGDYFLVAVAVEASGDWQDPNYLEKLSRVATRVHVSNAQNTTQDLTVIK